MKIYGVSENTAVGQVVAQLETEAARRQMTLSRWQANQGSHKVSITYAIHSGERAGQARYQEGVLAQAHLSQMEGTTSRSEAYRRFSALLNEVRNA
jgi:hypothetical protein